MTGIHPFINKYSFNFCLLPGEDSKTCQLYLPYVVEVSVRNLLLSCQLLHLIQENVHLELGAQVLETAVAERLPVARMEKKTKNRECFRQK